MLKQIVFTVRCFLLLSVPLRTDLLKETGHMGIINAKLFLLLFIFNYIHADNTSRALIIVFFSDIVKSVLKTEALSIVLLW